jgi:hypothetical protein
MAELHSIVGLADYGQELHPGLVPAGVSVANKLTLINRVEFESRTRGQAEVSWTYVPQSDGR